MQLGSLRSAVMRGNTNQNIFRAGLGILDKDVEIAVLIEDARFNQLEFQITPGPPPVFLHQAGVGVFRLGVFVQEFHIRVSRRVIQVKVVFLHVLAVVALVSAEAKQPFLQDRITAVPEGRREADVLMTVRDAGNAIFAPAISSGTRVVVREIFPRRAVDTVVLAHRPPLALT